MPRRAPGDVFGGRVCVRIGTGGWVAADLGWGSLLAGEAVTTRSPTAATSNRTVVCQWPDVGIPASVFERVYVEAASSVRVGVFWAYMTSIWSCW